MKIVFHIGTYKTGTSSIQQYLKVNRESLIDEGVLFPIPKSITLVNQHAHMVEWIVTQNYIELETYIRETKELAMTKSCNTLVFSSEGFSSLSKSHVVNLIKFFEGDEIEVILYFRNVYAYILSTLSQLLKKPNENFFSGKFINQLKSRLNYDSILNAWSCNKNNILVTCYDDIKSELIPNFLTILKIKDKQIDILKSDVRNISLGLTPMIFLILQGGIQSHQDHETIHKIFIKHNNGKPFKVTVFELRLAKMIFSLLNIEYTHILIEPILNKILDYDEKKSVDTLSTETSENWNNLLKATLQKNSSG